MHRTVVEDEHTYAVRIDDGALLDGYQQIEHARAHLNPQAQTQLAGVLGCKPDKLQAELDALTARAKAKALKLKITARGPRPGPVPDATRSCTSAGRTSPTRSG